MEVHITVNSINTECPVCLEEMYQPETESLNAGLLTNVLRLPCGHGVHVECLQAREGALINAMDWTRLQVTQ